MAGRRNKTSQQRPTNFSNTTSSSASTKRKKKEKKERKKKKQQQQRDVRSKSTRAQQQLRDDVGVKVCQAHSPTPCFTSASTFHSASPAPQQANRPCWGHVTTRDRISLPSGRQPHTASLLPASVVVIKHVQHKENIGNVLVSL